MHFDINLTQIKKNFLHGEEPFKQWQIIDKIFSLKVIIYLLLWTRDEIKIKKNTLIQLHKTPPQKSSSSCIR